MKMLDLNVDVVVSVIDMNRDQCDRNDSETNSYIAVKTNVLEDRQSEIHSATSVSSDVFNAGDHDPLVADDVLYCVTDNRSICIDIVSENGELTENLITKQFLPVDGYLKLDSRLMKSSSLPSSDISLLGADWLNLKVPESVAPNMQPVIPQKVRRSRRGPPSRSSQYRGVTFYRRTGRWESHIWFVFETS